MVRVSATDPTYSISRMFMVQQFPRGRSCKTSPVPADPRVGYRGRAVIRDESKRLLRPRSSQTSTNTNRCRSRQQKRPPRAALAGGGFRPGRGEWVTPSYQKKKKGKEKQDILGFGGVVILRGRSGTATGKGVGIGTHGGRPSTISASWLFLSAYSFWGMVHFGSKQRRNISLVVLEAATTLV